VIRALLHNVELSVYPQVALLIFLGVFGAVVLRVCSRRRAAEMEHAARLPLDDEGRTP
jgi:cbb3-type cytochrome oxidase subunit 3